MGRTPHGAPCSPLHPVIMLEWDREGGRGGVGLGSRTRPQYPGCSQLCLTQLPLSQHPPKHPIYKTLQAPAGGQESLI